MDRRRDPGESFRSLLLRYRGSTRLTQREFAARVGVHPRSIQEWETGAAYPTPERLQRLIAVLLESGGLAVGREQEEARAVWAAVELASPRMHPAFDTAWFNGLLAAHATPSQSPVPKAQSSAAFEQAALRQDWGEAPDTFGFVDRTKELARLREWVLDDRCRLVALLGMGGIGKTSLVAKLAQDVASHFDRVYWRGLRDSPPLDEWLGGAIAFLSDQQRVPPASESERIAALLQLLRDRRSLLILDNSEALFEPGRGEGHYRSGMAGYGRLLEAVARSAHQSCLVLTTREAPHELAALASDLVRAFELGGLAADDAQVLLAPKQLAGSGPQWAELNARFGGNGLALKVIGETIRELFGGEIGGFLGETEAVSVFGGIRRLLSEQVERSSSIEQHMLRVLAVEREPVPLAELLATFGPSAGRAAALEAIEGLRRRSLVERAETPGAAAGCPLVGFTLQSVVLEYVTDELVADVSTEILSGEPQIIIEQPLIKALAKDYVRQTQERLIGTPIVQHLTARRGTAGTEQLLVALLSNCRSRPQEEQGYGPGNVVNLLRLLHGKLRKLDLSHLAIRQAYLAEADVQDTSLVDTQLGESALAEAFDFPRTVALSRDAVLLAVATTSGQIRVWRVADRTLVWAAQAHTGLVWSVRLSADGQLLASGGADSIVRLWKANTGQPIARLEGHPTAVWGLALSADGRLVASAGADGTVRLCNTATGQFMATLEGHLGTVYGLALSANGGVLASGGTDGTVRL